MPRSKRFQESVEMVMCESSYVQCLWIKREVKLVKAKAEEISKVSSKRVKEHKFHWLDHSLMGLGDDLKVVLEDLDTSMEKMKASIDRL